MWSRIGKTPSRLEVKLRSTKGKFGHAVGGEGYPLVGYPPSRTDNKGVLLFCFTSGKMEMRLPASKNGYNRFLQPPFSILLILHCFTFHHYRLPYREIESKSYPSGIFSKYATFSEK